MRFYIPLFVLLFCLQASAQQKSFRYQGQVQAGLLEGKTGSAFQLQTIQGINYKNWSAGVGVGLDYYHTRSIPLFLALRKALGTGDKKPFVYAHAGYNFPWLKEGSDGLYKVNSRGGLYYDAGIGYQVPMLKKSALFFSLGFSQKELSRSETFDGAVIAIYPMPRPDNRVYAYSLRRLSMQMGLRF